MKRIFSFLLALLTCVTPFLFGGRVSAEEVDLYGEAKSVILMEASTGKVLYEYQADEQLPPASVTKIMTILLVMEEIDRGTLKLTDEIQVSDNASQMGGSQVFLKAGEVMTVEDLLKSVIVASANDASTALAEHIAGSVESFVQRMNERAKELGMENTNFENPTGLDDSTVDHRTSARDIALMSRELLRHEQVLNYTTIWMDSIRDGAFGLTNTNRLIRFYKGANGLKTGSTSRAGFCISATAKRDGMQLIAVVMGSPTRDSRNETAKKLLDYGFAAYRYYCSEPSACGTIPVVRGVSNECPLVCDGFDAVLSKEQASNGVEAVTVLPESLSAPITAGDIVGKIEYRIGDEVIGSANIRAAASVPKIRFGELLSRLFSVFFLR